MPVLRGRSARELHPPPHAVRPALPENAPPRVSLLTGDTASSLYKSQLGDV